MLGTSQVLHWSSTGVTLVLHWCRIQTMRGLHWYCTGTALHTALVLRSYCTGGKRNYAGISLVIQKSCTGTELVLHSYTAGALLAPMQHESNNNIIV